MKKGIVALMIIIMTLSMIGCNPSGGNGGIDNSSVEERNESGEFVFKGKVIVNEHKNHIEMEIVDSEIAYGTYHVLVSESTVYTDSEGNQLTRDDVKANDIIEVVFSGQVMQSLPPKISAQKIIIK